MAITSAKGKASLAKAAASHAEQKAAKQPGENKSTKGLGQIQAEAMGAPKGTSVAGGYLLSEDTKAGTQLPKVPQLTGDEEVDTSQPSPENVEAGASLPGSMVPEDQAIQALQNSGQSANDIKMATALTKNRYQQAHEQLKGTEVSQDAGLGKIQVQGAMTPAEPDMSPVDQQLAEDPGWNTLTETYKDYFNPDNQKASLMDTYKKEFRKLGLDELDEDIIDAQTIIDGTEDDIRNEVEQAGGFATDSQVQALSLSRNKVLLKNYNQLVALRESKQNQLDMMMNFAEKDRAYADGQFDRMTNYQMQMLNYRDKFIQNTRDQYNKEIDRNGYQGLYATLQSNPRQLAMAEQILGMGAGGIEKAASAPLSESDQLDLDIKRETLRGKRLENQALATPTGTQTLNGKPQSQAEATAQGYADRIVEADQVIDSFGSQFASRTGFGNLLPSRLQGQDRKSYDQAKRNFINAVLRRESGAAIGESEFESADQQYFPQPGDGPDVILQKDASRNTAINNLYREANVPRPVGVGQAFEKDGMVFVKQADGSAVRIK